MHLYETLTPEDVFMDFAGQRHANDPSVKAIEQLQPGDPLHLEQRGDKWFILNDSGTDVGRLARDYSFPENVELVQGSVHAIQMKTVTTRMRIIGQD